jgi:polyisoprenoid-binding protein YceI
MLFAIALVGAAMASSLSSVSAQDATPTPGVLATPAAALDCSTVANVATTYEIVSDQSEVRYVAEEELVGQGANTAIGSTSAFIGSLYFDADGNPLACSRWDADLRTLVSDSSRRDNFLYSNTLQTETYPLATFILTSVEGLTTPIGADEQTITLIGDLTIHGVTKSVSWSATVKLDGELLTGSASTSFLLADFGMEEPNVGSVVSIDDVIKLETDIVAQVPAEE